VTASVGEGLRFIARCDSVKSKPMPSKYYNFVKYYHRFNLLED
jgi:hypothetical protein